MADFVSTMQQNQDVPDEELIQAGKAAAGKMTKEHEDFLMLLIKLIDEKKIDPDNPDSFINQDMYESMSLDWKAKTDMALYNIAQEIRRINDFYRSKETPNESPLLETMIESLWQMKQRIETEHDVFKF